MSDDSRALSYARKHKRQQLTPERMDNARKRLSGFDVEEYDDHFIILMERGTITFWPYTGWFHGQEPFGKTKGRGIKNLLKALKEIGYERPKTDK